MIPRSQDQVGHLICSQFQLIFFITVSSGRIQHIRRISFSSQSANIQWTWVSLVAGVGIAYTMVPGDFFFIIFLYFYIFVFIFFYFYFDQLLFSCFLHFFLIAFVHKNWVMIQIGKARCWRAFFVLILFADLRYPVTLKYAL